MERAFVWPSVTLGIFENETLLGAKQSVPQSGRTALHPAPSYRTNTSTAPLNLLHSIHRRNSASATWQSRGAEFSRTLHWPERDKQSLLAESAPVPSPATS